MHLYLRENILHIIQLLEAFLKTLLTIAHEHIDTFIPGYTHLQRAEPVRFAHHVLAYFHMFYRDVDRLISSFSRLNISPLGAGALAGSSFNSEIKKTPTN